MMHSRHSSDVSSPSRQTVSNESTQEALPQASKPSSFSAHFKKQVIDALTSKRPAVPFSSLLGQAAPDQKLSRLPDIYIPETFSDDFESPAQRQQAFQAACQSGQFNEVQQMVNDSRIFKAQGWFQRALSMTTVPAGELKIISDHSGQEHGVHFMVWGPGKKKPMFMSNYNTGQLLGIVDTEAVCPQDPEYFHIPGRCTLIKIHANELGLVHHLQHNNLMRLLPGSYFINENDMQYIGKQVIYGLNEIQTIPPHTDASHLEKYRDRFQVVSVGPGHVAFVKTRFGTQILNAREQPYLIDRARGYELLNVCHTNQAICQAIDQSLKIVQLSAGEFISFSYQRQTIVWFYDSEHPDLNTLILDLNYFSDVSDVQRFTGPTQINPGLVVLPDRSSIQLKEEQAAAAAKLAIAKQNQETARIEAATKQQLVEAQYALLEKLAQARKLDAETKASAIASEHEARLAAVPKDKRFELEALRIQAQLLAGKKEESEAEAEQVAAQMQRFIESLNAGAPALEKPITMQYQQARLPVLESTPMYTPVEEDLGHKTPSSVPASPR